MNPRRKRVPTWAKFVTGLVVLGVIYYFVTYAYFLRGIDKTGKQEASLVQAQAQHFTPPSGCKVASSSVQNYRVDTQYAVKQMLSCSGFTALELDAAMRKLITANNFKLNDAQGSGAGWGCNIASDHDGACYDVIQADTTHVNARYVIDIPAPNPLPSSPDATNLGGIGVSSATFALTYTP